MIAVSYRPNRPTRTIDLGKGPDGKRRSRIVRAGSTELLEDAEGLAFKDAAERAGVLEDFTFRTVPERKAGGPPPAGPPAPEAPAPKARGAKRPEG